MVDGFFSAPLGGLEKKSRTWGVLDAMFFPQEFCGINCQGDDDGEKPQLLGGPEISKSLRSSCL